MKLPDDAVRCRAGDHLAVRDGDGWQLFAVEDFVAARRLVTLLRDDEPVELVDELPDGVAPAYEGPQLLLTAYARRFESPEAASAALAAGELGEGVPGVLRPLAGFPSASTQVLR